jgi:hypothetical protein
MRVIGHTVRFFFDNMKVKTVEIGYVILICLLVMTLILILLVTWVLCTHAKHVTAVCNGLGVLCLLLFTAMSLCLSHVYVCIACICDGCV